MVTLGMYWCTELYLNWDDQPVLTTITTAGLPVESVNEYCLLGKVKLLIVISDDLFYVFEFTKAVLLEWSHAKRYITF
jgi:hypothetical protein